MFDFEDNSKAVKAGRCDGCPKCKVVHCNGGWSFLGCYHTPYRGKWVAEIKDCPKVDGERKDNDIRRP